MAKVLKSLQSEGGFSIAESTIIDPQRNIIDVHTVKVLNNSNDKTFKKEFISHSTLTDSNPSVVLDPGHAVEPDRIVFMTGFLLGTWEGFPITDFTVNANSTNVVCSLTNHGLTTGDSIDIEFNNAAYSAFNLAYTVTVVDEDNFTITTASPLDPNNPILNEFFEITTLNTNAIGNWEYAVKIESAVLSDATTTLSTAAHAVTVVKDNVPPGQTWTISPTVNNVTNELSFLSAVSTNGTLQKRGSGIRWCAKVEIVYSERSY
jgi:hypothetical protein|tara:strand:- start:17727 stop:18512 length:786 start_codon:yes stop_codon:yes gene_type:complete